jgi:hypothetical protein
MSILPGSPHHRRRDLKDLSPQGQAAAEWLRKLANALKTSRLYLPDNVIVKQVRDELTDDLLKHLEYFGSWRFSVLIERDPARKEQVVRPSPIDPDLGIPLVRSPEEALPYLFYRDGIRSMTLRKGLARRDVDVLFEALKIVGASATGSDDLVTLLWQGQPARVPDRVGAARAGDLPLGQAAREARERASKGLAFAWAPSGTRSAPISGRPAARRVSTRHLRRLAAARRALIGGERVPRAAAGDRAAARRHARGVGRGGRTRLDRRRARPCCAR